MTRSLALALVPAILVGALASGCSNAVEEDDAASDEGAISVGANHQNAVKQCADDHPDDDANRLKCVVRANDAVIARLGKNLSKVGKGDRSRAKSEIVSTRAANELFCEHTKEINPADRAEQKYTSCLSSREESLASLIDGVASLGAPLRPLREDVVRTLQAECFKTFDAANTSNEEALYGATMELVSCIEKDTRSVRAEYVKLVRQHYPSKDPGEIEKAFDHFIDQTTAANANLCSMLADAGENGGSLAKGDVATCRVQAGGELFGELGPHGWVLDL